MNTKERYTLVELEPRGLTLDSLELDQLEACSTTFSRGAQQRKHAAKKSGIDIVPSDNGQYQVTAKSVAGIVETHKKSILIQPKIGIRNLLFIVSYCWDPRSWNQKLAFLEHDTARDAETVLSLFEAVAISFASVVQQAFQKNVLQGYATVESSENTIRGRLNFQQQICRRFDQAPPIECIYDDFSENVLENQIIKAAINRLLSMRCISAGARNRLNVHRLRLHAVSSEQYDRSTDAPDIQFSPLNEHYAPAIAIARFILSQAGGLQFQHGNIAMPSFLLSMPKTFEDFVVCALRASKALAPLSPTKANFVQNKSVCFDQHGKVEMKPDFSYWYAGRCCFVGDAKYKLTRNRKHKRGAGLNELVLTADLTQLLAYVTVTGLHHGMLFYAETEDSLSVFPSASSSAAGHSVLNPSEPIRYPDLIPVNTDIRLLRRGILLSAEPSHLLAQIESLGAEIYHLCMKEMASFASQQTVNK